MRLRKCLRGEVVMPVEVKGNFIRERFRQSSKFKKGSFKTVKAGAHEIILAHLKTNNRQKVQAILHPLGEGLSTVRRLHLNRLKRGV